MACPTCKSDNRMVHEHIQGRDLYGFCNDSWHPFLMGEVIALRDQIEEFQSLIMDVHGALASTTAGRLWLARYILASQWFQQQRGRSLPEPQPDPLTPAGLALRSFARDGDAAMPPWDYVPCGREHEPGRLCLLADGHEADPPGMPSEQAIVETWRRGDHGCATYAALRESIREHVRINS